MKPLKWNPVIKFLLHDIKKWLYIIYIFFLMFNTKIKIEDEIHFSQYKQTTEIFTINIVIYLLPIS